MIRIARRLFALLPLIAALAACGTATDPCAAPTVRPDGPLHVLRVGGMRELDAHLESGDLFRAQVGVAGLPPHRFG